MLTDASFPAECDGADQRNVAVEDTAAAISFVKSLTHEGRRKLDLGDTDNTFVKGKKTAIMVIISPSDATTAADPWNNGVVASDYGGSANNYVDAVVRRRSTPVISYRLLRATLPAPPQMARADTTLRGWSYGQLEFEWTTVGPYKVRINPKF
eukprot:scaffold85046_cov54-Phaeocystis_antarctica.AAC.2